MARFNVREDMARCPSTARTACVVGWERVRVRFLVQAGDASVNKLELEVHQGHQGHQGSFAVKSWASLQRQAVWSVGRLQLVPQDIRLRFKPTISRAKSPPDFGYSRRLNHPPTMPTEAMLYPALQPAMRSSQNHQADRFSLSLTLPFFFF